MRITTWSVTKQLDRIYQGYGSVQTAAVSKGSDGLPTDFRSHIVDPVRNVSDPVARIREIPLVRLSVVLDKRRPIEGDLHRRM